MDKLILVVPRDALFDGEKDVFQGFQPKSQVNYEERILTSGQVMKRGLAEENPNFKQPIAYGLLINLKNKTVFAYQRAMSTEQFGDSRLQGDWSWGVGGHVDIDIVEEGSIEPTVNSDDINPLHPTLFKEVREELGVEGLMKDDVAVLGYINDETNHVGQVHFGVLYTINSTLEKISKLSPELAQGKFMTLDQLEAINTNPNWNVENWSKIAMGPLKELFENV